MSIAELIMQGTKRSSESTAWVGDSLAKLGQQVGASLAEREQQKQAQEMLPFLQQSMQESMTLAGQGQSGAAYSKMLGTLNPETLNNPQLMPFVKLGFDAIGKSTDDYLLSQKATQSTSGMDSILPILALTNPQLASQLTAARTQTGTGNQPPSGGSNLSQYQDVDLSSLSATRSSEFSVPVQTNQGTKYARPKIEGPMPTNQGAGQPQAPSPTQANVAKGFEAIKQQIDSGTPFSSVMSESTKMIFPADTVKPFAKRIISIPKLEKYIPGAEGITELDSPDVLRQKGMNISSRSGMSLSYENIDPLYDYQKANKPFSEKINEAVSTLDADSNLQKAIKALGGFENISFVTDKKGNFSIEIPKGDKREKVPISKGTRDAVEFIAGVPQAAKNAMMPLYGTPAIFKPSGKTNEDKYPWRDTKPNGNAAPASPTPTPPPDQTTPFDKAVTQKQTEKQSQETVAAKKSLENQKTKIENSISELQDKDKILNAVAQKNITTLPEYLKKRMSSYMNATPARNKQDFLDTRKQIEKLKTELDSLKEKILEFPK